MNKERGMKNELIPTTESVEKVNSPRTLGLTPSYELKHNAIIRSAHNFSATAQKLTAMALSLLPLDLSMRSVEFSFADFCEAFGLSYSAEGKRILKEAATECMQNVIRVEIPVVTKRGKHTTSWQMFQWFDLSEFNSDTNMCQMRFNSKLADFLVEFKNMYSKLDLKDLGKLQSRYAIRLFEIAKSWESEKGKHGNKTDCWYFERSTADFRFILGVPDDAYQRADKFKEKVLDNPLKEINNAGVGLEMKSQSVKTGREVTSYRIDCKKVARKVTARKGRGRKKAEQAELPMEDAVPVSREDKDLNRLREKYPDEFAELYAAELAKEVQFLTENGEMKKKLAVSIALRILQERHGIVK
jgi:plasmid replication initiation protein